MYRKFALCIIVILSLLSLSIVSANEASDYNTTDLISDSNSIDMESPISENFNADSSNLSIGGGRIAMLKIML